MVAPMESSDEWHSLIRALLYPIIFEAQPRKSVDRVVRDIIDREALGMTKPHYQVAIQHALVSSEELCQLIPLAMNQSEATIRDYLEGIAEQLESNP